METERLILDRVKETDKEDYFHNISHDKKVLETFVCRYADSLEDFDFTAYLGRDDLFAIRLKDTGRLIGIILYFDEQDGVCEIGYGISACARSATGSGQSIGDRAMPPKRSDGF